MSRRRLGMPVLRTVTRERRKHVIDLYVRALLGRQQAREQWDAAQRALLSCWSASSYGWSQHVYSLMDRLGDALCDKEGRRADDLAGYLGLHWGELVAAMAAAIAEKRP